VAIPALMIYLSVALPAKVNSRANIIIAPVFILFILFNLAGEAYIHMVFGAIVEVVLLCLSMHGNGPAPKYLTEQTIITNFQVNNIMENLIKHFTKKQKTLFLIDSVGAFIMAFYYLLLCDNLMSILECQEKN
jgi:hypothetical protein